MRQLFPKGVAPGEIGAVIAERFVTGNRDIALREHLGPLRASRAKYRKTNVLAVLRRLFGMVHTDHLAGPKQNFPAICPPTPTSLPNIHAILQGS